MDLAGQRFSVIVADPPWRFESWSAKGTGKSAEQHYGTMPLAAIKKLPVKDLATKDSVLLLWTVSSMLPEALEVVKGWGFRYTNVAFDWVKVTKDGIQA